MPIRSVKLKLLVPRRSAQLHFACDLWSTHKAINKATRFYEEILLQMRGKGYVGSSGELVPDGLLVSKLDAHIKKARHNQGFKNQASPKELSEIRALLQQLYAAIVPSFVGEKGDAQQANAFLSPLTDLNSKGFESIFDKIRNPPPWLQGVRDGEVAAFEEATRWLGTDEGKARLNATGAPPKWVKLVRKNDPQWALAFVEDWDRKIQEVEGVPKLIRRLRQRGVLPLFNAFLSSRIEGSKDAVSRWDRLAFRLAVGHLLSWESWCRLTAEEHTKRVQRVETFRQTYLEKPELAAAVTSLQAYEVERQEELSRVALPMERAFRLRPRMVRGWPELLEQWLKSSDRSHEKLLAISAAEQTRKRGKFGDPHLFSWLARSENHHIWTMDTDAVSLVAKFNAIQSLVERSRESANLTLPDPILHPRSVQWEPEGGSNLKNYRILAEGDSLSVCLPLLTARQHGYYSEVDHLFKLAPSGQLRSPVLRRSAKSTTLTFKVAGGELQQATLNSADLLLKWDFLRNRHPQIVSKGNIGPVYLKLALDVTPAYPEGWDGRPPNMINHFISALGNNKHSASVIPGLRVLAVDMGVRHFGACSVFELKQEPPAPGKLSFPVDASGLWAVHERSFLIDLPGESPDNLGGQWRSEVSAELRRMRRTLSRYRSYYEMSLLTCPEERLTKLNDCLETLQGTDGWDFEIPLLEELKASVYACQSTWKNQLEATKRKYRHAFGLVVREWRRRHRDGKGGKSVGKSMWGIDHITEVRRFLQGWTLLGTGRGDIRRLDRQKRGVFASRLLDHLEGMKDDRLKTGADLIVQAARGYLRDEKGRWQKKYQPCHAVLFEDLSRYRMKTDRPRRENTLLMRWAHRAVPEVVRLQGELYGINICNTSAAFSSRYHASSQTPGIRCHPIATGDLDNIGLRLAIQNENPGIDLDKFKVGDLVPLSGGEVFVCLKDQSGKLSHLHADINAAQNLQRRFWTRHADPFRLPCCKVLVKGEERWVPRSFGKRVMGALGSYGWLVPTDHESGSCRWVPIKPAMWRSLGSFASNDEAVDDRLAEFEGIEEEMLESTGEVIVFFRDPSGVVLPGELWYPAKMFWGTVKARTSSKLKKG